MSAASQIAQAASIIASGSSFHGTIASKRESERSPSSYHRRSGTLKMTQEQAYIAQQRSQSLFDSVAEGEIEIDAILAIPIDWAGIAAVKQYNRSIHRRKSLASDMEALPTMDPYTIKTRPRSRQASVDLCSPTESISIPMASSSYPTYTSSPVPMSRTPSALGLDVHFIDTDTQMDDYSTDSECPPSPAFSMTASHRSSYSASEASTPPPFQHDNHIEDPSFDLKSYCSAFHEGERDSREEWWTTPRPQSQQV